MKISMTQVASTIFVSFGLLVAASANAQTRNADDATQAGRIDWSGGNQSDAEVNSLSQPTRFSQRSNIPQSRTGNEAFYQPVPTRERGGPVPDRLNSFTNRSEPLVR